MLLVCAPAWATDYEAQMDPAPFDATTRADILGSIGQVSATLTGNTLTVNGTFKDMTSPAIAASVRGRSSSATPSAMVRRTPSTWPASTSMR